ncbi:MAG TPA: marine proteobacterial sortase target protein [Thermoanaerobaculia bacterium]|nr:marine proteobacterial sortase target protein [Thermoanaerobaculia bacterium]
MRSNRFLTATLLVSLLIMGSLARAEEGRPLAPADRGLFFRAEGSANVFPAPVLGTVVEMRVTGIVARAKVTQIFTNPGKVWLEGVYVFPLPDGAAVDTLRMVVGERVLEGVIQEKNAARQTYEVAKQQGVKASLVEQQRPDVFTTSIANIGPGETVEITIEMQQVVRWNQGKFRLRFPMAVAPRYTPPGTKAEDSMIEAPVLSAGASNPFSFHVDLSPGFPVARIASSSHDIAVEKGSKERYAIDLAKGVAPADSDFLLEWSPAVGREPRAVFYSEEVDGEHYGLLMVMPPDAPEAIGARIPREAIFVIDTSGSMDGESMEQARKALLLALDRLQPDDWFNVIEFDDDANALFSSSVPAQPQFVEKARGYVSGLAADGGTNILAGMEFAFVKSRRYDWLVPQTLFITDGQVGNEAEVYKFIDANLGTRRLFTVAIGSAPNVSFLRKAAELGRGTFTHIATVETVAERMGALFAQLEAPMLRDLEVRWDDPSAETGPARIPDLYLGEPLIVTVRQGEAGGASVSGSRDSGHWEDSFPAPARVRGAGLDKLWAQRKIEGLLDGLDLGTASNRDEVQREVTALGLRHHLVTRFTSLVAVDVEKTAPAGVELVRGVVPVNRPRGDGPSGGGGGGEEVQECITVTAESPLIDERRIASASRVSQYDLDNIPTARDPWAVLQSVPGVLTDRVNVGGNESGMVAGQGASGDQQVWSLDGLVMTDLSALGSSPGYYNFNVFEEIQVTTGGADASLETPGVQVSLVTKRGTNEWRGSALGFTTTGEGDGEQNRLDKLRQGEIEGGGPLRQDRLWIWGALHGSETERTALGGGTEEVQLGSEIFKANAQFSSSNAVSLLWSRGNSSGSGLGASPSRGEETTWERDGREETWKIEDTQILGSDFYITAALSGSDRSLQDLPRGGPGGDLRIGPDGAASGTWFGLGENAETRAADLRSSYYFNTGNLSHELRTGLSWRDQEDRRSLTVPDRVDVAGGIFGLDGLGVVESWRGGEVSAETGTRSAWIEDLLERDKLKFVLGLRYDEEDLGISRLRPRTLSPRLGLTWTLGDGREGLLRASLARFASRLGTDPAFRLQPFATTWFQRQPGGELSPWYTAGTGNSIDSGLAPEITDELVLGGEYAPRYDLVFGLQATWRRTADVLEERLLVEDASGRVFAATAFDWVPAGRLTGVLPDGSPYDVPYFDLRPGLSLAGGTQLVNGDRERDFRSVSLTWQKRLEGSWSSRGHLTWSNGTWSLGPEFARYDDPTRTLGAGDRDGESVVLPASDRDRPYASDRFAGARWSLHWEGLVQLPRGFHTSFAVNGREGYPFAWYRQVARERAGLARVQLADAIDADRADDLWTLDARLGWEVYLGGFGLTLGVDVFNLLGEDVALWRETDLGVTRAGAVDEALAARTVRLGVRVSWQ